MVPTVDRGLRFVVFCSIEIAGLKPSIESTSGRSIWSRNCRAYADSVSTYRRWPSAYIVSKANELFPDPDNPVTTVKVLRGMRTWMSCRLCWRAPRTEMCVMGIFGNLEGDSGVITFGKLPSFSLKRYSIGQ